MKSKPVLNYIYIIVYRLFTLLTPIITVPYLTRTLKATNIGIYNYTYSLVSWFALFGSMGISIYGCKEIAKVSNDDVKLSNRFSEILSLQVISSLLSIIVFYTIFLIFNFKYKVFFLLQGLTLISIAFDISWLYAGVEDFKKIALRGIIIKLLLIIGILLLVNNKSDLGIYIIFVASMNILGSLVMWINLNKITCFKIPKIKIVFVHFKKNLILFIPQISISIYSMLDRTMIGLLYKDISEVGFYSQAHRFVDILLVFITTIGTVMLPNIVKKASDNRKAIEITNLTFKIALFLSIPISVGCISISPFFISWFLPIEFKKVIYIICILSPIITFVAASNVLGVQFLITINEHKKFAFSVIVGSIMNIIINLFLIKRWGAYGAALASVVTEFIVFFIQYLYVRKVFNFNGCLIKLIKYLIVSIIMGIIVLFIGYILGGNLITNIIQVIIGFILYMVILYILKDDIQMLLIKKIKK